MKRTKPLLASNYRRANLFLFFELHCHLHLVWCFNIDFYLLLSWSGHGISMSDLIIFSTIFRSSVHTLCHIDTVMFSLTDELGSQDYITMLDIAISKITFIEYFLTHCSAFWCLHHYSSYHRYFEITAKAVHRFARIDWMFIKYSVPLINT